VHKPQQQVRDLHRAIEHPAPSKFTPIEDRLKLRLELIREEFSELVGASGYRVEDFDHGFFAKEGPQDPTTQVDALCDLLVVTFGMAVEMGIDLEPFFDEVHRTNMAKVGGPKRADGKGLKPLGWTPPDIAGLLKRLHGVG